MKKKGVLLCICAICITCISGMLIGCSAIKNDSAEDGSMDITGDSQDGNIENPPDQSLALEENKYRSVLLGKSNFICTDLGNKSLNISEIGQAVTDDDSVTVTAAKFTVIDMDGDGEDEAVLWLQINGASDYGFAVLHDLNGEIYGYTLQYRACMDLKTDGTFLFSGGAADSGIGKMTFSETGYSVSALACSQSGYDANNELTMQYFVNDEPCSEDEFNDIISGQEEKTNVEWHDLSEDNVNSAFVQLFSTTIFSARLN